MVDSVKISVIDVDRSVEQLTRDLNRIQKRHIPLATAKALTFTAERAQKTTTGLIRQVFRNPIPFTVNSIRKAGATKTRLIAEVFFKDISNTRTHYLEPYTRGGRRPPKPFEERLGGYWVIGKDAKTNAYGNLTPGTYSKILADVGRFGLYTGDAANTLTKKKGGKKRIGFFMQRHQRTGRRIIYKRTRAGIVPWLVEVSRAPRYGKRIPFNKIVKVQIDKDFNRLFEKALARELKR